MPRRLTPNFAAAFGLLAAAPLPAFAGDPTGLWLTDNGDSKIKIVSCGPAICGTVAWLKEPNDNGKPKVDKNNADAAQRNRPIKGVPIILSMKPDGADKWSGQVYNAEDGKTYSGNVTLTGANSLKLQGCVAVFCKTKTWTRSQLTPSSSRALAEQHGAHGGVRHIDPARLLDPHMHAAQHRGARTHALEPALEMRERFELAALPLGQSHPSDARHIGDRIGASEKVPVFQPRVHHAVDAVHLVAEALDGVVDLLGRITAEVVRLAGLRPEVRHLPEQPFVDRDAAPFVGGIEFSGLAAEVLQDRAGLEHRDRPAARTVTIDDRRHAIVR